MSRFAPLGACAAALLALALPATAFGHAERTSYYPNFNPNTKTFGPAFGHVPQYRRTGPRLVVCKADSRARIVHGLSGELERKNLELLRSCRYRHIQTAVNDARNGYRILVLPGIYREEPSRRVPLKDPRCKNDYENGVPNYNYERKCPTSRNLIAIVGDDGDADRRCDDKCNIQIEGTGRYASSVQIRSGGFGNKPGAKLNVIKVDRADGIYLRNFMVELSDFNNIYALETNGFVFQKILSRYSREYGFLSFVSDQGLYDNVTAVGSGDSGIYPGAGPEGHCKRYGIEIKNSDSYANALGYSGTAGNGVWAHHNRFHHNAIGMVTDSFVPNHPGMPQDCVKWENNQIYSNNVDLYNAERDEYCKTANRPIEKRDPRKVCPTFPVPVGTGMLIAGGNGNIIRNNRIWDNWRRGTMLHWVPATLRGEDPTGQSDDAGDQYDVSNDNSYTGNIMGVRPDGKRDPNGTDHWWDEQGEGNCWSNNKGPNGAPATSDPPEPLLPDCPQGSLRTPGNPGKQAFLVPCATWEPQSNTDPPGCDWFTRPDEPR